MKQLSCLGAPACTMTVILMVLGLSSFKTHMILLVQDEPCPCHVIGKKQRALNGEKTQNWGYHIFPIMTNTPQPYKIREAHRDPKGDPQSPSNAPSWPRVVFFPWFILGSVEHLGTWNFWKVIPSGKLSHNYGKSPFSMGKSTINHHFQ